MTSQVYLAAVRNFSHRGLEGGDRLLSITTRDGRFVHFRMPASASSARCAAWFEAECPQHQQRRRRRVGGGGAGAGAAAAAESPGSGREELWKRGLWGAGSSELWMERLVDEVRSGFGAGWMQRPFCAACGAISINCMDCFCCWRCCLLVEQFSVQARGGGVFFRLPFGIRRQPC